MDGGETGSRLESTLETLFTDTYRLGEKLCKQQAGLDERLGVLNEQVSLWERKQNERYEELSRQLKVKFVIGFVFISIVVILLYLDWFVALVFLLNVFVVLGCFVIKS